MTDPGIAARLANANYREPQSQSNALLILLVADVLVGRQKNLKGRLIRGPQNSLALRKRRLGCTIATKK